MGHVASLGYPTSNVNTPSCGNDCGYFYFSLHVPEQPSGRLWHVTRNRVCCRVAQHLRRLGYPYTAHTLRHRFATVLYEATGDINVVRDLLGHSKTTTTQVYVQISVERRRAAVAMIS